MQTFTEIRTTVKKTLKMPVLAENSIFPL